MNRVGLLCASAVLVALVACGGGDQEEVKPAAPPKPGSKLVYVDPTSGSYQLRRNVDLSRPTHLVLDLVASNGSRSGTGVSFKLTTDESRAAWAKVVDTDEEFLQNGGVFQLGSAPKILRGSVRGPVLMAVVAQKGMPTTAGCPPAQALQGVLARVALDLRDGALTGDATPRPEAASCKVLLPDGTTQSIVITPGTMLVQ